MNTINMRPTFRVNRGIWHEIEIHAYILSGDGERVALPSQIEWKQEKRDEVDGISHPPLLTLHREAAQQLMDEFWAAGVRPSNGEGSSGQLAATERHLSDMRALVFKQAPKP